MLTVSAQNIPGFAESVLASVPMPILTVSHPPSILTLPNAAPGHPDSTASLILQKLSEMKQRGDPTDYGRLSAGAFDGSRTPDSAPLSLSPDQVRWMPHTSLFQFKTTKELPPVPKNTILGQDAALEQIRFGAEMPGNQHHIFVRGPSGSGKLDGVLQVLNEVAPRKRNAVDLVAVNDPLSLNSTRIFSLPAGTGDAFEQQLAKAIDTLKAAAAISLPKIPERYQREIDEARKKALLGLSSDIARTSIGGLNFVLIGEETETSASYEIALTKDASGMSETDLEEIVAKLKTLHFPFQLDSQNKQFILVFPNEGDASKRVLSNIAPLFGLDDQAATEIERHYVEFRQRLASIAQDNNERSQNGTAVVIERSKTEAKKLAVQTFTPLIKDSPQKVQAYLLDLIRFLSDSFPILIKSQNELISSSDEKNGEKFDINSLLHAQVIVSNKNRNGAPVVVAKSGAYEDLFGKIELVSTPKGIVKKIKSGTFLRANGGYLVINTMELLRNPGSWEALMTALETGEVEISNRIHGYVSVGTEFKSQKVEANVKVVLLGDNRLFELLSRYEPRFAKHFNAPAQFEPVLPVNETTLTAFFQFVRKTTLGDKLLDLTNHAVGALLEFSARLAGNQKEISTQFGGIAKLMQEANYYARQAGSPTIEREHVQKALEERNKRLDIGQRFFLKAVWEGIWRLNFKGKKTGQINGLAVLKQAGYTYGEPMRVAARASLGRPSETAFSDVMHAAGMTGPLYTKAAQTVRGFLFGRYAQAIPFLGHVTWSFEQNYGGIEGDSATLAEMLALLSALGNIPLRQDLAITGSADLFGQAQAIGGVNEKIEGFWDAYKASGVKGKPTVIIPLSNVSDLMLREDIVQAIRNGEFKIIAVNTVEQAMEIASGLKMEEIDRKVQAQIQRYYNRLKPTNQ